MGNNDVIKYLAIVSERTQEVWRVSVEGMANDDIFTFGLNILRTLEPGYRVIAVR